MAESDLISWQYLAGFFDGEGNISLSCGLVRLRISQKASRPEIMHRIGERLEHHEIAYSWRHHATQKGSHHITMTIHRQMDVKFILQRMLPYLIVKREQAVDMLLCIGAKKPHGNLKVRHG